MPFSPMRRLWFVGDCPPQINDGAASIGYGPGCAAIVYGGTPDGSPDAAATYMATLPAALGLSTEAAATLCVVFVEAFLWTIFWDGAGAATPPVPAIPEWPPT